MASATKSKKTGTYTFAVAIDADTYHKALRPIVDRHKSSVKKVLESCVAHLDSLSVERQAALIRGELNEKKKS